MTSDRLRAWATHHRNHVSVGTTRETVPWPRREAPDPIRRRDNPHDMLRDLPDLAAHLALRATTSTPGAEPGGRREAATIAPASIAILHALDHRIRYQGDDQIRAREDEAWRCQHHTHDPKHCPNNPTLDDAGRQGALADLAMWARMIHADLDEYDPQPDQLPDHHTWTTVCNWLDRHLDQWTFAYPDEAGEFLRDLTGWHSTMRRELGETDPVRLRHRYGDQACGHEILQRTDSLFQCRGCLQTWSLVEMMRQARWHSDVTLAEAADQTGVKLGTLKQWVKRGKLQPVDDRRPARYRLRDVRDLADQSRRAG